VTIYYKEGYDKVLTRDYAIQTPVLPPQTIIRKLFTLHANGFLEVFSEYAWDGATGVPDFKSTLEATVSHDVFCQLMNEGILDYEKYAPIVHAFFGKMCRVGGFWFPDIWQVGVILGKGGHPSHLRDNIELSAP